MIGHFVSQPLLTALAEIVPEQVIANGSAGLWNTMMDGMDEQGDEFAYIFFSAGGMGAAHDRDGLSATAFPSGIMGVPVEAIETAAPLLMHRRELRPDSGGAGRFRGGLGQVMEMEILTGAPTNHSCMYDRTGIRRWVCSVGSPARPAKCGSPVANVPIPRAITYCGRASV